MLPVFTSAADVAASLSIIAVLSFAYARFQRATERKRLAECLVGMVFGVAAAMEMLRPFEPMDGLIIDFRTIPVAFAGAFLGWRGVLVCIAIAMPVRFGLGGVGVWAGLLSIGLAAVGGVLWARLTHAIVRRTWRHMVLLAFVMSVHLAAGLVLPQVPRTFFYGELAFALFLANLAVVPLLGAVFEIERRVYARECTLRDTQSFDLDTGVMTHRAFCRDWEMREAEGSGSSSGHALVLKITPLNTLERTARKRLLGAVHHRLRAAFPGFEAAGGFGASTLLLPVSLDDVLDFEAFAVAVRRVATEQAYVTDAGLSERIAVDIGLIEEPSAREIEETLLSMAFPKPEGRSVFQPVPALRRRSRRAVRRDRNETAPATTDHLFAKADHLLQRRVARECRS